MTNALLIAKRTEKINRIENVLSEYHPGGDFLYCLKGKFSNAKFLYLADEIAPETEMSLRAGGLIFLGSYDHFTNCAHQILGSVADSVKK
jgi:hypothetical protein